MAATLVDKMAQEEYATEAERARDEGIAEGVCASAYIAGSDTVSSSSTQNQSSWPN